MILLDNVVEILHLADFDRGAVRLIVAFDRCFIGLASVDGDLLGDPVAANRLHEKAARGLGIKEEVRTIERASETTTFSTPLGSVGLEMVLVDVYREADGFVWLIPVPESQIITVPLESGLAPSTGAYDLTRLVTV